jgi:phosphoribosylamine--glycine ligase
MSSASAVDVLVVGGGGREHALVWKLRQSPRCGRLLVAPGNAGMAQVADCIPIPVSDLDGLTRLAVEQGVGLVVVGPEAPLAAGLADRLIAAGIPVFGPTAAAARIESSKAYARDLMTRAGVPQPAHGRFTDADEAEAYLDRFAEQGAQGAVVKASGLAAGKGAIVCDTLETAREAVRAMLVGGTFGAAGSEIVIEERLQGEEASLLVITDGETVAPLPAAQDYKRVYDGDAGPNTGGMGSYAPAPLITPELYSEALDRVVRPVLRELAADGAPFRGCLYAGVMLTPTGMKVIEFNCRFGDPETQAIMPLLAGDLLELFLAAAEGRLAEATHEARALPGCGVSVVLASGGYPDDYQTGEVITGLSQATALPNVTLFHAGTIAQDGKVVTAGGRVLAVTGIGADFRAARDAAYSGVAAVRYEGQQFRSDIAARVVA